MIRTYCAEDLDPWLVAFIFWFAPSRRYSHFNCASFCALLASVTFPQIDYPDPFLDAWILGAGEVAGFCSGEGLKVLHYATNAAPPAVEPAMVRN